MADPVSTAHDARLIQALVDKWKPLLAGQPSQIQGAALADMLAIWVTGHRILENNAATRKLWDELLEAHLDQVRKFIDFYAQRFGIDG